MMKSTLEKMIVEDNEYYFSSTNTQESKPLKQIHLLPLYDEFIMGYKDRDAYFQARNQIGRALKLYYDSMLMTIRTVKAVKKGTELCINYNATPDDDTKVWFDAK